MNNRDRILKLMAGEKPDRVPWFGDLDYWYGAASRRGSLDENYKGEGYFNLTKDNHIGFYLQGYEPFNEIADGVRIKSEKAGDILKNTIMTPKGELTEIFRYMPVSFSSGYVKHFVESAGDIPAFEYYIDSLNYEPNYQEALRRKPLIGGNGVTLCYTPKSPFMSMITTYSGVEKFFFLLADESDMASRLLEKLAVKHNIAARMAVDSPAEFIMIPENLSSEVVGERYYIDYLRPYEKLWIDEIRKAGKYSLIHMDGTLRGLIRQVAETGFDIIEAVTTAPVGDMSIDEVDHVVGRRSVVWGGVPGAMLSVNTPVESLVEHVKRTLALMRMSPRFVLGVADQLPPDGELDRLSIVASLCDEYGKYE